jgi:hypothetical protein
MAKVAKLVKIKLQVLVTVEDDKSNYEILKHSRKQLINKIKSDELYFSLIEYKIITGLVLTNS